MNPKDFIPVPDLRKARNVLVIVPHPDDAELAAGGTAALLTGEGARVTYAIATDGSMGSFDPLASREQVASIRRREQEEAASVLGVNDVHWLGFPDGFLPDIEKVRGAMVKVIRLIRPDFLVTLDPWLPYEGHPDHRKASLAAVEAAMYAPFPLAYPEDFQDGLAPWQISGIALALSVRPNTFIGVDATWGRKIEACLRHKSQFPREAWNSIYYPYIQAMSAEWGREIGAKAAEAFKVMHPYHLHTIVDAWRV